MSKSDKISVNGKSYKWPSKPAIIICLDGSEPGPKGYIDYNKNGFDALHEVYDW